MDLIFSDPYYDSGEYQPGRFARELSSELAETDPHVKVVETDIGRGADWPVALVTLFQSIDWPTVASAAAPITVYFLGERIKKNGEAWLEMARALKRLLRRRRPARIDEKAALLIVLEELTEQGVTLTDATISLQVIEHVAFPRGKGILDKRPDAVYLIGVALTGESYVYAVEAEGNVAWKKRFADPYSR